MTARIDPFHTVAVSALAQAPLALVAIGAPVSAVDWPVADNLVTEPWIDQASLLPWCQAVVSHGGAGTVLGALTHGLPQLVLPQGADHFVNACAITRRGVGLMMGPESEARQGLTQLAMQLLREPRWRAAAQDVADEVAAMPSVERVATCLIDKCWPPG